VAEICALVAPTLLASELPNSQLMQALQGLDAYADDVVRNRGFVLV
jgi:hypothetical protein